MFGRRGRCCRFALGVGSVERQRGEGSMLELSPRLGSTLIDKVGEKGADENTRDL